MRRVSILGVTGSIGRNTVEVMAALGGPAAFDAVAVTGGANIVDLAAAARGLDAEIAVTAYEDRLGDLRAALAGTGIEAAAGATALNEAAARPADWIMAAIVGAAGLPPTLAAARQGTTIALANKECLVSAGGLFLETARAHGAEVIPVDSEHSAIFQCLDARARTPPARFVLTASGGPFRDWPVEKMAAMGPEEAAAHPNFSMGLKISIDSATMFNKALEMVEARWLFGATSTTLDVVVHPQSIVHSAVCYPDGAMIAQLGVPDMRTAIGYALTYPARGTLPVEPLDLAALARLDFEPPDEARFPAVAIARHVMDENELSGAVLNAAKEAALDAFIARRIGLLDIARVVTTVLERLTPAPPPRDVGDVFEIDAAARRVAEQELRRIAA
ncbi:MAG: 1-deoxy-D-xylulose-5-phosphate reductoisomerase [Pseudomonadota bacterium]